MSHLIELSKCAGCGVLYNCEKNACPSCGVNDKIWSAKKRLNRRVERIKSPKGLVIGRRVVTEIVSRISGDGSIVETAKARVNGAVTDVCALGVSNDWFVVSPEIIEFHDRTSRVIEDLR